ncbi:TetR family transcriptional regulator [Allonocardiopsis opalescens]|uniref:TetR family transcriptional regulator n=2 Tax=Allonocardiopsis opalescens TaxID=1144618 RepID=A0A2T0PVM1_9ACTN|nr:TetR family transcriptional regulator [Allonocardiopsis opalescens]
MRLVAERGLRGLTHRAVDEAAGLPAGSTSYHARTRARLLEITLRHLADETTRQLAPLAEALPGPGDGPPGTPSPWSRDALADVLADFVHTGITRDPARMRARYELALESVRRPELRAIYDELSAAFHRFAATVLTRAGSPEPARHARTAIAWTDGLIFDSLVGGGAASPPTREELRCAATEMLAGLLDGPTTTDSASAPDGVR